MSCLCGCRALQSYGHIQSIATQKNAGGGQGCSLDGHLMSFRGVQICFSRHELLSWRAAIKSVITSGIPLLRSAFHSARRSTESKATLMSRYATFKGLLNSQWISESKRRARMASMVDLPLWNLTAGACACCQEVVICEPRSHERRLSQNWQECDGTVVGALRFWAFALVQCDNNSVLPVSGHFLQTLKKMECREWATGWIAHLRSSGGITWGPGARPFLKRLMAA